MLPGRAIVSKLQHSVEKSVHNFIQVGPKGTQVIIRQKFVICEIPRNSPILSQGLKTSAWLGNGCRPCTSKPSVVWSILEKLGFNRCRLISLRRRMKRYCYPWLCYSVPAALILATGDFIAQYYFCKTDDMTLSCFVQKSWNKERTLVYLLTGFLIVGPVLSWWNLMWTRKLRCKSRLSFVLIKSLLDVLVLAPILLSLMALIYDQTIENNITNTDWEKVKTRMECRYLPAIKEVLLANALTRPLVGLLLCFVVPQTLRKYVRLVYELAMAAFVSRTFALHKLREYPGKKPPPPAEPVKVSTKRLRKSDLWKWPC